MMTQEDTVVDVRLEIRLVAGGYILTETVLTNGSSYSQTNREQIFVQPRKMLKRVADFLESHKNVVEG